MRSSGKLAGIALLALLSVVVGIVSIAIGSVEVSPSEILKIIFSEEGRGLPESTQAIIWQIRLPRVIMAFIAGGVLAVAGASFQALLRNPLADPFILGVSGGAAMGGVLAIISGWAYSGSGIQIFAFSGALMTILFVYFISRVDGQIPKYKMLLAGVVVNAFLSALIMLILTMATDRALASALFWLMGDLSGSSWERIVGSLPYLIAGLAVLYMMSREMNLLLLGEEQARELGTDTERVKFLIFIAASLVTGVIVSVSGLIGFVGLIVPHAARLIWGADHRFLFPASLLLGGAFLTIADTTARTVMAPTELPVGVITALVGGPVFVYLMKKRLHE
ncbi:MAG: iron ABC transporter permease [Deltaproteobacteria bacterium]|nr:iron ABC transporter permease [Deltaproteobacteria bacterium]